MIVVDVETTGPDERIHSIVSIGAVEFEDCENQFYEECQKMPGSEVEEDALMVNGFTLEGITDMKKPTLAKTIHKFIDWARQCGEWTLAGHNINFDRKFLEAALQSCYVGADLDELMRVKWPFGYRTIDTHTLCYTHYLVRGLEPPVAKDKYGNSLRRSSISLDTALEYVGMPSSELRPHNALTGAKMAAEVIHRITLGRPLFPEYVKHEVPSYLIIY